MVPMVIQFSFGQILIESALHSYLSEITYYFLFLSEVEKFRPYSRKVEFLSKVKPNEATHLIGTC